MKLRSKKILTDMAKDLRQSSTEAEQILWEHLRNRQLEGVKFRRQEPIGEYIVDFVCLEQKLVIEVDGEIHKKQKEYDRNRSRYLSDLGFQELRFWNSEIMRDLEGVVGRIRRAVAHKL